MTERKPAGVSFQSWIERQIQDAMADGAFDDLAPAGRPIADIDTRHHEMWWLYEKLKAEDVSCVPPSVAIRKTRDMALIEAATARTEADVRRILDDLNAEIRYLNSHHVHGPPTTVATVDVDEFVARWSARDGADDVAPPPT